MSNHWKDCWAALAAVLLFVLLPSINAIHPAAADRPSAQPISTGDGADVIEGSYIVQLKNGGIGAASVGDITASSKNIKVSHEYSGALHGFSAEMSASEAAKLRQDPRVALVEPNRRIYLNGGNFDIGVDRVNAELNSYARLDGVDLPRVSIDIAIVDTGVGPSSQLNVAGGHDCSGSGTYADGGVPVSGEPRFYHGTFVAGLAAGIDNGGNWAGAAPGARIWSLRVFDNLGESTTETVVCALDWVRQHGGIEVVNLSLGAPDYFSDNTCNSSTLHYAICQLTNAGTTVVVSAGNDASNASGYVPAKYPEVITVSALADTDGKPGGFGGVSSYDQGADDTFATWSNYGSVVDICAPGVDLFSLAPAGGYQIGSGTSFSSPLVAGAAALYLVEHPGSSPSSVRSGLLARRERVHMPHDRDSVDEGILNASGRNAAGMTLSRDSAQVDMAVTVNLSGFLSHESVKVKFDSTLLATTTVNSSGVGTVSIKVPAGIKGSHYVTAASKSFAAQKILNISPRIKITPTSGIPGSSFGVSLRGFAKAQKVTIRWYNGSSYVNLGSVTTSSTGSANDNYYVPTTYRGGHKVEAVPSSGGSVSTTFAVKSRVKITPSSGASGASATVEIKGFVKSETVKVYLLTGTSKKLLRTLTASSTGSASSTVTIPLSATLGSHTISAEGTLGSVATASFNVTSVGSSVSIPTATATAVPTQTATPTPVVTEPPTASPTVEPPTETATPTEASTETPTALPTESPTDTPAVEPTATDTPNVDPTETAAP
jgi:subtilisin